MGKVIRLNDHTLKLLEKYRSQWFETIESNSMSKEFNTMINNDNFLIGSALSLAIELDTWMLPESK